jgi:Tfp pilus assembly protein PilE
MQTYATYLRVAYAAYATCDVAPVPKEPLEQSSSNDRDLNGAHVAFFVRSVAMSAHASNDENDTTDCGTLVSVF